MGAIHQNSEGRFLGYSAKEIFADLDQMRSGIAIFDSNMDLVFANKQVRIYLPELYDALDSGKTVREALEIQVKVVFPDLDEEGCLAHVKMIFDRMKHKDVSEIRTPSGDYLKSTYSHMENGGYIVSVTKITDHIEQETKLDNARVVAEAANLMKSQFLANMSHEIRTPMAGMTLAANLLQKNLLSLNQPDLSELAEILVGSAKHLSEIINDVLIISKIEAGQIQITRNECSLRGMLETFIKSQNFIAAEKGVELKLVIEKQLPEYLCFDELRIRQCVANLVGNALKFTPEGSVTVAVLYDAPSSMVTVHVADTGVGLPRESFESVFDQFEQVQYEDAGKGTGLGLCISRNLARLMGGDITVASELGKGSIFSLTFESEASVGVLEGKIRAA